jgi:8-oxo-dGTP diphosphatase
MGASPDIEPASRLAYPDRRKAGQTNRLAVRKLVVNETFPKKRPVAEPAFQSNCFPKSIPRRMTDIKLTLVVACALVDADKRVLIAQRPPGKALAGLWEFPGGKLERGERPEQTLIRELHEEIGITVKADCLAPLTFASHAYDDFHLLMPLYICRRWDGDVIAREGQQLAWVRANKLRDYPMPPADIPLIPHLIDLLM